MSGIKGMKFKNKRRKPNSILYYKICEYGCGNKANFKFQNGRVCCSTFGGNCPAKRRIAIKKFKQNVSQIDPITGIKKSKTMALKGAAALRNTIDPATGLTMDIIIRQKIGKIKKESGSAKRAAQKMINQRRNNIDPGTGFDQNKQIALKGKTTRLNDIDENGLNSYDRMWLNSKTVCKKYKETKLYYQSSYEFNFLKIMEEKNLLSKIRRGPTISYSDPIDSTPRTYFPDFLIENTIYEIKSKYSWFMWRQDPQLEKNIAKLDAAKNLGYEVILVLDGIEMHWPVTILK